MATNTHPSFPQPPDDTFVWRYLAFTRFASNVEEGRLYMPCAEQLGDALEGTRPKGTRDYWEAGLAMAQTREDVEIVRRNIEVMTRVARHWRANYFVSCWNLGPQESYSMWRAYAASPESVVIKSTYGKFRDLLPDEIYTGQVRYLDYTKDSFPTLNMFDSIMHKDLFYRDEVEVRAVMNAVRPPDQSPPVLYEHPGTGIRAYLPKMNYKALIQDVILHPAATKDFAAKATTFCELHGLPRPIGSRALLTPRF